MSGKRKDPQMRFWPKINFDGPIAKNDPTLGECWDWTGNFGSGPYGLFWDGDRMMNSHKFAYESAHGEVPEGLVLDHFACDRKSCVNPDHLKPVTHQVNSLRSTSVAARHAAATHCPHGHEYNIENTYIRPDGKGRGCYTCRRAK